MKYRKLTSSGDYTFGAGNAEFYTDSSAVGQAVQTRLDLWLDTFWRDLKDGTPFVQQILGKGASDEHLQTVDQIIQNRIKGTTGLLGIVSFSRTYNRDTRAYKYNSSVQTIFSNTVVSGVL